MLLGWHYTVGQFPCSVSTTSASFFLCASICIITRIKKHITWYLGKCSQLCFSTHQNNSTSDLFELFCNMKTLLPLISLHCSLNSVRQVWVQGDWKKWRMLCSKMFGYNPILFHWRPPGVSSFWNSLVIASHFCSKNNFRKSEGATF